MFVTSRSSPKLEQDALPPEVEAQFKKKATRLGAPGAVSR
jgi:putative transposon-encoded protein